MPAKNSILAIGLLWILTFGAARAMAQEAARQQISRAELRDIESRLARGEGGRMLATVQARLRDGDFREGDRILLRVVGEPELSDTFTVRTGQMLPLPNLPNVSLAGLLRSELEPHLQSEISKTLRSPQVFATSFVRLAVTGGVASPGFYQIPAAMPLTDAIMLAGGPLPNVKFDRTVLRRRGADVADASTLRGYFARGLSLDQASVEPGDEIVVARPSSGSNAIPVISLLLALATTVAIFAQ